MAGPPYVMHLTCLDIDLDVRTLGDQAASLYAELTRVWAQCLRSGPVPDAVTVHAVLDDRPEELSKQMGSLPLCVGSTRLEVVMDGVSPLVTQQAISAAAGSLLMLHAGVVADPTTRRAVALVGPSGAGKTTAVRRLSEDLAYVTDECAGIREDLSVSMYPKPFSVVVKEDLSFKTQEPPPRALIAASGPITLGAVVMLRREPGHDQAMLEPVPILRALATAATETSFLSRLPDPLARLAAVLTTGDGPFRATYSDAEQLVPVIGDLLAREA